MTNLNGVIRFEIGSHRLHAHMVTLSTMIGAIILAINCRTGFHEYKSDDSADIASLQFPSLAVRYPYVSPIDHLYQGVVVNSTEVRVIPSERPPSAEFIGTTGQTLSHIGGLVFANFFEENLDWLVSHFGSKSQFSEIWTFARIVRNAISHDGTINITSDNAPSGTWHHLTYGYANRGTKIIGPGLYVSDLTILMIELAEDLDRLGAPQPS